MYEEVLRELKEHTKWLRFLALPELRRTVQENLKTKEQKRIFELSDGKNSSYDISTRLSQEGIKVSDDTVRNYWKRWFDLGIVIPSDRYSGRFGKMIGLEGLAVKE